MMKLVDQSKETKSKYEPNSVEIGRLGQMSKWIKLETKSKSKFGDKIKT